MLERRLSSWETSVQQFYHADPVRLGERSGLRPEELAGARQLRAGEGEAEGGSMVARVLRETHEHGVAARCRRTGARNRSSRRPCVPRRKPFRNPQDEVPRPVSGREPQGGSGPPRFVFRNSNVRRRRTRTPSPRVGPGGELAVARGGPGAEAELADGVPRLRAWRLGAFTIDPAGELPITREFLQPFPGIHEHEDMVGGRRSLDPCPRAFSRAASREVSNMVMFWK